MTEEVLRLAKIVWQYHQVGHSPEPADVIIALGTNDLRVAAHAAELYRAGYAPLLVCTGGIAHQHDLLATNWEKTEAEMFAAVAMNAGVPADHIFLETQATNTSENIRFARDLLAGRGMAPRRVLFAVKNFMQRRVAAHLGTEWSGITAVLSSPRLTLEEYFTPELTPERIINIMLGDLQRLWVYAARGWSAPQEIPEEVMDAFHRLVALGYDKHLIDRQ